MRAAYALIGFGFIMIFGALYIFTRHAGDLSNLSKKPVSIMNESTSTMSSTLLITSSAFENNGLIPSLYTCDGQQLSPPLTVVGVPVGAKSLALIVDDPDVPKELKPDGMFDHWVLFNIPPATTGIAEGATAGIQGANGAGKNAYTGPCPPKQYEPSEHRYFFKLFALDTELSLATGATKSAVEQAMSGHIIGKAQLVGKYRKK